MNRHHAPQLVRLPILVIGLVVLALSATALAAGIKPNGFVSGSRGILNIPPPAPVDPAIFRFMETAPTAEEQCAGTSLVGTRGESITFTRSSAAFCTTSSGTLAQLSSNQPRVEAWGLLMEPAATNILLRSQEFDNATWVKERSSISANTQVAPDGTTTADTLTDTTDNNTHRAFQGAITVSNGAVHTLSCFAKAGTANWIRLSNGADSRWGKFNVSTCAIGGLSNATTRVQQFGNGWCRASMTYFTASTSEFPIVYMGTTEAQAGASYVGSGSTVHLWGCQLETGNTATSYVATSGSSVTRNADSALVATTASWPKGAGEFSATIVPEWNEPSGSDQLADTRNLAGALGWDVFLETQSTNNRIATQFTNSGGGNQYPKSNDLAWAPFTAYDLRVTWAGGTVTFYRDGAQEGQATGQPVPDTIGTVAAIGSGSPVWGVGGACRCWVRNWMVK
jgi:hypothetical protein